MVRLYSVRLGKKSDCRAILFELESTALRYPCPFFQDYMLGYGDHFDREYMYMPLSSSKERLDAGDKLAIYLTGDHHGALHVLWQVNKRFT